MPIIVKDANNANQTVNTLPALGQAAGAASLPVVLASDNTVTVATTSNAPRRSSTTSLAALNAVATLWVDGMSTVIVQVSGTWVGTVSFFASVDGGTTYFPVNMIPYSGGVSVGSTAANGVWEFACGGLTHVQVQMTAWTSGSASAVVAAANGAKSIRVGAPVANPVPVITPVPSTVVTGQVKIATTGNAVALPSAVLVNGIVVKAKSTNAAQSGNYSGMVGPAGVTTTFDGTGTGYALAPGEAASFAVGNANLIYVNGTAGDVFTYSGN